MSSSSSSSVSATTVNGTTRFSGLSSGIDVDSLVEDLMTAESTKLDKMKQQQQLLEWKQEQYREVITDLTDFVDTYLSLTSSESILKQSNFLQFSVESDSTAVTAVATASAVTGSHTLTVSQLATGATQASATGVTQAVTGSSAVSDFTALADTSFTITVDGTARTVSFDAAYSGSTYEEAIQYVQDAVDEAVGAGKVVVSTVDGTAATALTLAAADGSGVSSLTVADASSNGAFSAMGFDSSSNLSNRLSTSDTLGEVAAKLASGTSFLSTEGEVEFTINGQTFTFDEDDTLSDMINTVNKDTTANVTMSYDTNTDQLIITADETGAGKTLTAADTSGTFFSSLLSTYTAGVDAKVELDGTTLTRSANSFTEGGITYTLNKVTTESVGVDVSQDTEAIYDVISNFVTAYNELLETINGKLAEEYDSDYAPLTEAQEAEMSDSEIESWNEQAQTGLLANDMTLAALIRKVRTAVMSSVSGVADTLTSIGITTSTYTEQGKLHIDEDTLKAAIAEDPEGIKNLFTQASTSYSGTTTVRTLSSSERAVRTSEEGLAYKLYDILQDYVGTIRDASGNKGLLLEKAGMENDTSDTDNSLTTQLETLADKIEAEEERLDEVEDRYYDKFTAMETALSTLSSQYSIISSFASS